jgi:hypothetical protein
LGNHTDTDTETLDDMGKPMQTKGASQTAPTQVGQDNGADGETQDGN